MRRYVYIALTALLLFPAQALADFKDKTPVNIEEAPADAAQSSGGGAVIRTLIGLILVLAIIYGFYRLLRYLSKQQANSASSPAVEMISRTVLDRDTTVYVVRSGDQVTVMATGQGRSETLRQLPLEQAHAEGLMAKSEPQMASTLRSAVSDLRIKVQDARQSPWQRRAADQQDTTVASLLDDGHSKDTRA